MMPGTEPSWMCVRYVSYPLYYLSNPVTFSLEESNKEIILIIFKDMRHMVPTLWVLRTVMGVLLKITFNPPLTLMTSIFWELTFFHMGLIIPRES